MVHRQRHWIMRRSETEVKFIAFAIFLKNRQQRRGRGKGRGIRRKRIRSLLSEKVIASNGFPNLAISRMGEQRQIGPWTNIVNLPSPWQSLRVYLIKVHNRDYELRQCSSRYAKTERCRKCSFHVTSMGWHRTQIRTSREVWRSSWLACYSNLHVPSAVYHFHWYQQVIGIQNEATIFYLT